MGIYEETVEWMFQQLPMYQQVGNRAYRADLSNITKLAEHLGNPHHELRTIHVAGTNGKGSVSHMLASVLQESGYRVGLYTSPHLKDFRERIRINGLMIPRSQVINFISQNRTFLEQENYSFFEMTVGMAFHYFSKEKIDIAVIEVGLGGRLDSTNIVEPDLCVITNIGLDHVSFLGTTLPEIAAEKGGIIKPGKPVVIGESHPDTLPVFRRIAAGQEAPIFLAEENQVSLPESDLRGFYQVRNKRTVLRSVDVLRNLGWEISTTSLRQGLLNVKRNTGLRGRWEVLREKPRVICDTAHNEDGLRYVLRQLLEERYDILHIVLGVVNDKDLKAILPLFPRKAKYYFCKPAVPRGMPAEPLRKESMAYGLIGEAFGSVRDAYDAAIIQAGEKDVIFIGGSTFTVAEII